MGGRVRVDELWNLLYEVIMAEKRPVITQEDTERIMRGAPDYILDASDVAKDLFVIQEWARELRDLSPQRYYSFLVKEGTEEEREVEIDFQQVVNVSAYVKSQGGDITLVRQANAKRLQYLRLDRDYQRAVRELNKALGTRSRRPRNIVDYTGTILELFGKFYTITDVVKVMAKEYRIKVPEDELKKFYVENRDLITRRRAEYVLQNKDFRVATETGRLEVLNQMLTDIEIKNRAAGGTNVDYCNLILRIVEQARKEVKGNEIKMTVDGRIDINATLHAESNVTSVMSRMSINALVIGLTAAKAGLNPAVLIGQLAHSWYSQFNGFNGNIMDGASVELPSSLIKQYDWEKMERMSKKFVDEFTPIEDVTEVKDVTIENTVENKRKLTLERLKAFKASARVEMERANPVTPDSKSVDKLSETMTLTPTNPTDEDPKGEFEIDYNLNKKFKQKKGMRIKGAIEESIGRHKAAKEEGVVNISKAERQRQKRLEARRKRREERKRREQEDEEDKGGAE